MILLQGLSDIDFIGLLVSTIVCISTAFAVVLRIAQKSYNDRLMDAQSLHVKIIESKDEIIATKNKEIDYHKVRLKECDDENLVLQKERFKMLSEIKRTLESAVSAMRLLTDGK